jgi:hypothetical protein
VALKAEKKAIEASAKALKEKADQQARLNALGELATAEYNSMGATLLRKLNAGDLSEADLPDAQNNFQAAKNNLATIQRAPFDLEGIQTATARFNEARRIFEAAQGAATNQKSLTAGVDSANFELNSNRAKGAAAQSNLQNHISELENLLEIAKAKADIAAQTRLQNELDTANIGKRVAITY